MERLKNYQVVVFGNIQATFLAKIDKSDAKDYCDANGIDYKHIKTV